MSAAEEVNVLAPELLSQARMQALMEMRPVVEVLERLSGLGADAYAAALGRLFHYPVAVMSELATLEADFDTVAYAECVQRGVAFGRLPDGRRWLVCGDPFDAGIESWRGYELPPETQLLVAHKSHIHAWQQQMEARLRALQDFEGESLTELAEEGVDDLSLLRISADGSHVIRLVNSTIYDALKIGASDIHLECEASGLVIQYRVDGVLVQVGQLAGAELAEQVISRIKILAELDIAERRVPQDGRFKVRISGREIDFRVSVMPSLFGEDAVLRLLDRQALTESAKTLRLDVLGLDDETMAAIRGLASRPHGMLLVTGPTGSGKTTTLYAAITEIHTGRDKIITIEDPVEYRLPRTLQIPVNEKKGLTFARGLRSILRHDPDKIMVGEIRDDETAQIAVQAALTGHMVFTTVHANSVFDVVGRFLHMGVDPYSLSSALNGIVAQRLFRLNCTHCAAPATPEPEVLQQMGLSAAEVSGWNMRCGSGCGHCRGTGYKGRRAAAEVLVLNDQLRELIAVRAPLSQLKQAARETGIRPLRQTALAWVARGDTTLDEVARVTD
ncbi:MAG: ral secretion pathway protein GspE [Moraxellaceae bacterium]|jgi:general secretion pathway protein E|nr:ral secretion pathway protein GspE [Moraxellaceae bacterium]